MAVYDGFFDAVLDEETQEYDRDYGSDAFTDYFAHIVGSGVCIYRNPDSFKVRIEGGSAVVSPGYLFIQGYWLRNNADYTIPLVGNAALAISARLNLGKRMIELDAVPTAESYPDSLVLALINPAAGTAEDTRHNTDICGVIDTAGELSSKVVWAMNYIDTEIESKLAQAEVDISAQEKKLDAKIAEVQSQIEKIVTPAIGEIKFTASNNVKPEWLLCDGRLVSKNDYPELVSLLLDVPGFSSIYWTEGKYLDGGTNFSATDITYGDGKFVLVFNYYGTHTDYCLYSNDGLSWSPSTLPGRAPWKGIAYGNGKFVAVPAWVGNGSDTTMAAYSADGIAWALLTLPVSANWDAITYGGGKFVALGHSVSENQYVGVYSTDGINWEQIIAPPQITVKNISYGNGKFLAVSNGKVVYSTDTINWVEISLPIDSFWVSYGNGIFLSVNKGKAAYSADGIAWAVTALEDTLGTPNPADLSRITYGNGKFMAVGGKETFGYTSNGIDWEIGQVPNNSEKFLALVGYGAGIFISFLAESEKTFYTNLIDSARLPKLSVSEIPAYIKAKETKI